MGTTLAFYCTQSVQPHFLPYFHNGSIPPHVLTSGPIPPHLLTQWAPPKPSTGHKLSSLSSSLICTVGPYLLIFVHSGHHPRLLLHTECPASFPPLLPQWFHTSSCFDQWAYTPSFSHTVGTTLAIYCTQTIQPHFSPYFHSGSIPPHFRTQ